MMTELGEHRLHCLIDISLLAVVADVSSTRAVQDE